MSASSQKGPVRPWRRAAAAAVAVHAVLFLMAIRSVKITSPPPEPQAFDLQLVQLQPRPPPPSVRKRPAKPAAASPAAASAPPSPAAAAPPAPLALAAPATAPGDDAAGRVRAMLRGSVGCDSAAFLKLTAAERRRCAERRSAHVDPNLQIPAPIDPAKRSWFEADLRYRELNRRMPMGPPGSLREEGKKLTYGAPPGHALFHLGPLGVGLPGGAFNDDSAPPP